MESLYRRTIRWKERLIGEEGRGEDGEGDLVDIFIHEPERQ